MKERTLFCKVTWMPRYRGERHTSTRYRNIKNDNSRDRNRGAEEWLFKPHGTDVYGYVHAGRTDPHDDDTIRSIAIERLGADEGDEEVNGVHVIWVAARLDGPGVCVVGDYSDATVHRTWQPNLKGRTWGWNVRADRKNARVVPERFRIPLQYFPLRMGNLWYAEGDVAAGSRRQAKAHLDRLSMPVK